MTQEETFEGNKLIAEFMGAENETGYFQASTIGKTKVPTGRLYITERFPNNMHMCSESELQYNTSFDWLMPVVEKIAGFGYRIDIKITVNSSTTIGTWLPGTKPLEIHHHSFSTPVKSTYSAVVEFIKWYNQQSLTP